ATLSATGHAAALAPASPARTAGGESQAYDHCQTAADSLLGTDSLCFGGGTDPDPASFPHQTTALDLQRTGIGNPHHWRTPLRKRTTATFQETDLDSWPEQGPQPRFERSVQSCRHPGECTARTISGFLPEIAGERHQADDGASHFCSDCAANPFSSSFLSYRVRILERDAARTSDPDLGQRLLTSAELADIQPSQFLNDWRNIAIALTTEF